ncbi:hypothetical protein JCM16408A_52430 [Methylobacterium phyllosphaerae]
MIGALGLGQRDGPGQRGAVAAQQALAKALNVDGRRHGPFMAAATAAVEGEGTGTGGWAGCGPSTTSPVMPAIHADLP